MPNTIIRPQQGAEPCARCPHAAQAHAPAGTLSWQYCNAHGCQCPGYTTTPWCVTCDLSPKWAGYAQCLGCLIHKTKPCDVIPKYVVAFDAVAVGREFRLFRQQWEIRYPQWELIADCERRWPESAPPSRHADRETSLGRKLFYCRWRVERRHPRRATVPVRESMALSPYATLGMGLVSRR